MSAASSDYSRALVYRPGDPSLLASVSTLKTRHWLRWSLGIGAVGALLALLGWNALPSSKPQQVEAPLIASTAPRPAPAPSAKPAPSVEAPKPVEKRPPPSVEPAPKAPKPRPTKTAPAIDPGVGEGMTTRRVSIRITGASGGSVKIDGRQVEWFGQVNEVPVGSHTFEFLPPNDSCCLATKRQVDVPAGEGDLVVVGSIPFKDAVFVAKTPENENWNVSCPTLFAGSLRGPGRRSIPLSQVEVSGSCLVSSPQGGEAGQKVVTLRAGQTSTLTWP